MLRPCGPTILFRLVFVSAFPPASSFPPGPALAPGITVRSVFQQGEGGIRGFRIPGFLATNNISLHVFAEGRMYTPMDDGYHTLVYKRSTDAGLSFSDLAILVDPRKLWGANETGAVFGPSPVRDVRTGAIHVLFAYAPLRYLPPPPVSSYEPYPWALETFSITSTDNGLSFSIPRNISSFGYSSLPHTCLINTGAGGPGIQLQAGPHKGRLLVPGSHQPGCNMIEPGFSHLWYSDDGGVHWAVTHGFMQGAVEGSVVELFDGKGGLAFIARRLPGTRCTSPVIHHCAGMAVSSDGGMTFGAMADVGALPDPGCKNTVTRWEGARSLVHAGASSPVARVNVSTTISRNDGASWQASETVWPAPTNCSWRTWADLPHCVLGGYTTVQVLESAVAALEIGGPADLPATVAVVFENNTISIAIATYKLHVTRGRETRLKLDDALPCKFQAARCFNGKQGQAFRSWRVDGQHGDGCPWEELAAGDAVGNKRIELLPDAQRLTMLQHTITRAAAAVVLISNFAAHHYPQVSPTADSGLKTDDITSTMFTRHGLPLTPFGSYTFEPPASETSSIANTKRGISLAMGSLGWHGPGGYPSRALSLELIHTWLDRCDAVGTSVLYDLSSLARPTAGYTNPSSHGIENVTSCDKCFALIEAEVEAVKGHPSIVGWYIADEPDGTTGTPAQWDERIAVMTKVSGIIHKVDAIAARPTVACLLSVPWYIGSTWQLFLNATDQVWIDLYEDPPGSARTWNASLFPQSVVNHNWATPAAMDAITDALAPSGRRATLVLRVTGGMEDFERSPSPQEIRATTYLAWIHGSLGVVYFEHSAPPTSLDSAYGQVPSSLSLWAEVERLSLEGAQLSVALQSGIDGPAPSRIPCPSFKAETKCRSLGYCVFTGGDCKPKVPPHSATSASTLSITSTGHEEAQAGGGWWSVDTAGDDRIHAAVFVEPARHGPVGEACPSSLVVLAVNLMPSLQIPTTFNLKWRSGAKDKAGSGGARPRLSNVSTILFVQPRPIRIFPNSSSGGGAFSDVLDAYGTRAYRIELVEASGDSGVARAATTKAIVNPLNVLHNPSFEAAADPDVPDGFQIIAANDSDASFALESRDSVHGRRSLRMNTPTDGQGMMAVAMPTTVIAHTGKPSAFYNTSVPWTLSVWAKGLPVKKGEPGPRFQVGVLYWSEFAWRPSKYNESIACGQQDPTGPAGYGSNLCINTTLTSEWKQYTLDVGVPTHAVSVSRAGSWVYWELVGRGVAWIDLIQLTPTADIGEDDDGSSQVFLQSRTISKA